jgi:spoIIIJ-associated protein
VAEFLEGLVESFGLEGQVEVQVQEDVIVAVVSGEQTEALVGTRGSVMEAIHEITKTVLHRQAGDTARVRLDVAGYAERRRQALSIYAGQLINQVLSEGGEIMLEPMSAADRKVIHDAVAAHQGVRSYSEGEAPRRYVVIAVTDDDEDTGPESDSEAAEIESEESAPSDQSDSDQSDSDESDSDESDSDE